VFEALAIPGLCLYRPKRHGDARGYFMETWSERVFSAEGLPAFLQDNEALSGPAGTVRGLHFQTDPFAQAKLLRCVAGAVFDVVVDIRRGSPAYGKHVSIDLLPETGSLFIPAGCAHGYCTTAPDTLIQYKVTAPYAPASEGGIAWDDPDLGIAWPVTTAAAVLSDRDRKWPRLSQMETPFSF
jgi:dTDP-4-dehydrorhamnose 3,5-epimerase